MIKYLLGTSAIISVCLAAVAILQTEEGQLVQLELGPQVRTWGRTINGEKQYLKACEDEDNSDKCIHWSDEKGTLLSTTSKSRVFNNGSLIIYQFEKADVGAYFSPDERERVVEIGEDSFGALPRTLINLIHVFV